MVLGGLTGLLIAKLSKQSILFWVLGTSITGVFLSNLLSEKMKALKDKKLENQTKTE